MNDLNVYLPDGAVIEEGFVDIVCKTSKAYINDASEHLMVPWQVYWYALGVDEKTVVHDIGQYCVYGNALILMSPMKPITVGLELLVDDEGHMSLKHLRERTKADDSSPVGFSRHRGEGELLTKVFYYVVRNISCLSEDSEKGLQTPEKPEG